MATLSRFGTHNDVLPKAGPKAYPVTLDFTVKTVQQIDMEPEVSQGHIDFISGIYIDNRKNAASIEVTLDGIGQSIGIPAGKQSYMPLCASGNLLTFTTVANATLLVPVIVVNFPVFPIVW